ncbi:MAG: DUF1385 domain-containing protein [Clostridia bacterium]|nr:DUF1385 domain-containing protein [Clostridia bacterium]
MRTTTIGGQAVMEGVMMKSENNMAIAVRQENGEILVRDRKIRPMKSRSRILSVPFIRGAANLVDSLTTGMKVLSESADMAGIEEEPGKLEKWLSKKTGKSAMDLMMPVALVISVLLSIGLYIVLPALSAKLFQRWIENGYVVNLLEGLVRVLILFGYLLLVSQMKDIRRLLGYHGAEHKTIACYEAGEELIPENAKEMSRFHPRCGTSFLVLVMLISLVIFVFFGTFRALWLRVLTRLAMIPIVAGISYEALKLLARGENRCARFLRKPGLAMQRFTTREPDESMLEVAIAAFKRVLEMEEEDARAEEPVMQEDMPDEEQEETVCDAVPQGETDETPAAQDGETGTDPVDEENKGAEPA